MRRALLAVMAVVALVLAVVVAPSTSAPATAAPSVRALAGLTGSEFDPGMIISDQLFYDSYAMSAAQIQAFLNGKIGTCQTDRCLNVAVVPVTGRPASYATETGGLVCSAITGGTMLVSELIFRTQVACGISAKVILVTLQKEQGLVTSRAPSDWALRAAMGMGCPDTAPCSDAFAGLATQIMSGTRQLKVYKVARFARQPGNYFIQYHPNASCGGTNVNIRNYATAALYNYTPYQPNAAALANLGGTGNSCSSYGNRNFWTYYRNWFGSVAGAQYLTSTVDVDYLITRDENNELWGYPVGPGGWGLRTSLGAGWSGLTDVMGVGDLDGNGYRDIIARDSAGVGWFYPGDGTLDYLVRRPLSVDWTTAVSVLYGGNLNGDVDPDMLTIDAAGDLWLWPGDGTGNFRSPVKTGSGFGAYTAMSGLGDFTGDRCGDLMGISATGVLMLFAGNCTGGFRAPTQVGVEFSPFNGLYNAGDFSGDGRPDLWARDGGGALRLFRGTGGGAIASTTVVDYGWGSMQNISGAGMRPTHPSVVTAVSSTDDMFAGYLIARDTANALWAYPANAAGTWRNPRVSLGIGWGGVTDIIGVGDLDGNGYRDLIARDTAGKSWYYPGDGRLDYPNRRLLAVDWASARNILYGGYFDADANPDMLTVDAAGDLWLWPGNGAGGFGAKVRVAGGFGGYSAIAGVADFDGDRCGDIVAMTSDKRLMLIPGDCAGGVKSAVQIGSGFSGYSGIYSMGDFTADRIPDLWLMNTDGVIRLFRGTGGGAIASTNTVDFGWGSFLNLTGSGMEPGASLPTGQPSTPTPTPTPTPTDTATSTPTPSPTPTSTPPPPPPPASGGQSGVGDINGDAKRDFLGVSANGHLRAYYGDGAGRIGSDAIINGTWGSPGPLQFPMGDFTGDGLPDLGIIASSGNFLIARGKTGGFESPVLLATNWTGFDVVTGSLDWNGDGFTDVLAKTRTGQLWLYKGNGLGGWASMNGVLLATGWNGYQPIPVGNFEGSGGEDMLALQSNGDLWLYRGDGAGGWASLNGTRIATGWTSFATVFGPGDFDGVPGTDVLARGTDGKLWLYPGDGVGGLLPRVQIDSGWETFRAIF